MQCIDSDLNLENIALKEELTIAKQRIKNVCGIIDEVSTVGTKCEASPVESAELELCSEPEERFPVGVRHEFTVTGFTSLETDVERYTPMFNVHELQFQFSVCKGKSGCTYLDVHLYLLKCDVEAALNRYVECELEIRAQNSTDCVTKYMQGELNALSKVRQSISNWFTWETCDMCIATNSLRVFARVCVSPPIKRVIQASSLAELREKGVCVHTDTRSLPGLSEERARCMLDAETGSDCEFVVGRDVARKFRASKLLLAKASPVFEAMFYGGLAETGSVRIPDIEPHIFRLLLEAVYGCGPELSSRDEASQLYRAAHKYLMTETMDLCMEHIWPRSAEDVWEALDLATELHLEHLEEAALNIIRNESGAVLSSPTLQTISQSSLVTILRQTRLKVASEVEVFNAAVCWAAARCQEEGSTESGENLRGHLSLVFRHIRFLAMSLAELTDWPFKAGVFTEQEVASLTQYVTKQSDEVQLPNFSPFKLRRSL